MKNIRISLPFFDGFYESIYDSELDFWIQQVMEENGVEFDDVQVDYEAFKDTCKDAFVNQLWKVLPKFVKKIKNAEVWSPKSYNYVTDKIYADVELENKYLDVIVKFIKTNYDELAERIKEDWSSRSGFISLSDDVEEWLYMFSTGKFENDQEANYLSVILGYMIESTEQKYKEDIIYDLNTEASYQANVVDCISIPIKESNNMNMNMNKKRALYESIMSKISKEVKKAINEGSCTQAELLKIKKEYLGSRIRINHIEDDEDFDTKYTGKQGFVEDVDDNGMLFGTWGAIGLDPFVDDLVILG